MARPALGCQVNPLVFHLIYHTESFRTRLIFYFRLRGTGLLSFCRLVEGGFDADGGARTRFQLDRSLLSVLVDRWRPETHTFHLPCGEMAPTLQDVAYLLGLPLVGPAVGPRVVPRAWLDDLEARFAPVQRVEAAGPLHPHPRGKVGGPARNWLLQFQVCNVICLSTYL